MKGQVSLEYSILLGITIFLFIVIGTIVISGLGNTDSTQDMAQNLASQIKAKAIQTSLSPTDITAKIYIPEQVNGRGIEVHIFEGDALLIINDSVSGEFLAKEFLPELDAVNVNEKNNYILNFQKVDYEIEAFGLGVAQT